jgi:two-component system, LytTR family, response regulator LytT
MSLSVVIIEDEPLIAQRLVRLTRKLLGRDVSSVECAADLASAAVLLPGHENLVLLLDLNLSGEDGFALLRQALAQPCQTIVISANTARAMEAFELGVVDFVPKPFTEERLASAFQRARERAGQERVRYLAVTLAGKLELIPLDSVVAIHGDDDYSSIETLDGRRHLHRKTLSALLEVLPPTFKRVHRSHIVNLSHVVKILTHAGGRRTVVLPNGVTVPATRSHMDKLSDDVIS